MADIEKLSESVRAVDRALDILMAFTDNDYELSVAELLKRVDLSRPTLYRLLYTLEKSGFVASVGEPQKFRLGPSVAHLAHVWTTSLDIGEIAQPFLHRIREKTGETVALLVPQGKYRLCIAELPSMQPLSFKRGVGYRERVALGASGRAILAHQPDDLDKLREYAADAGVDQDKFANELELIRRRGYAVSKDELIQGAVAVAAPYFGSGGQIAGSIAVFGPGVRMHASQIETYGKLLLQEGLALSRALGYTPSEKALPQILTSVELEPPRSDPGRGL